MSFITSIKSEVKFIYHIFIIVLLIYFNDSFSQDLPHHLTNEEKELLKNYIPPYSEIFSVTPPEKAVRASAEWEELQGILITWTSYTSILRQIVDYAQEECLVYIVCSDSNSVKSYLQSGNVPLKNLVFIIAPFNSVWSRDYGPWSVYSDIADSLYIIDWIYNRPRPNDDLIPVRFAEKYSLPLYQTTVAPYNLTHTGGNFMTDGHGTGFSSKLILDENSGKTEAQIDTIMKKFMGINRYIKMTNLPYDGIHHIDMHMKLLDEETLLVGEYPPGISDGPQIEANLNYILSNFKTCFGRDYRVIRIPMPPDASGKYPSNGGVYRTFTNSAIINKTVLVPTYDPKYDTTALRIYREAMPGYNVVGINCNQIISASGAIHCIVKDIGVKNPVFISHPKILSVKNVYNPYEVKAFIKSSAGIESAYLFWTTDTSTGYNSIIMNEFAPDSFSAVIPQQPLETKIFYYIKVIDNNGKEITKPIVGNKGPFTFIVDGIPSLVEKEISEKDFVLNQNFPNPFNSQTTISYSLPYVDTYNRSSYKVKLNIYNSLGKLMETLVDKIQYSGLHKVEWKADNIPSGMYIGELKITNEKININKRIKLLLIK